jgi:DNA-binding NtrC family response regulator
LAWTARKENHFLLQGAVNDCLIHIEDWRGCCTSSWPKKEKKEKNQKEIIMSSNPFKIVVLEDNEFYNTLLSRQLENYTSAIAEDKGYDIEIQSYTNPSDCIRNIKEDTDVAIVDYYLGDNKNGLEVLRQIKQKSPDCRVVIISQVENMKTSFETLNEGAFTFIYKDRDALMEVCHLVEDVLNERLTA